MLFGRDDATRRVAYALKQYRELSERHRAYLDDFEDNCRKLLECIDSNYSIIEMILEHVDGMFENASRESKVDSDASTRRPFESSQMSLWPVLERGRGAAGQVCRYGQRLHHAQADSSRLERRRPERAQRLLQADPGRAQEPSHEREQVKTDFWTRSNDQSL